MARTHLMTCNLCDASCGLAVDVEGEQIQSIRGDQDDPFSQGYICPKATALQDIHADPDRLKRPIERTATGGRELDWDEAFDKVATRIQAIQAEHGRNALAIYQGNPTVHSLGAMTFGQIFMRRIRTHNRYSATFVDQPPQMLAGLQMFGSQIALPVPDIDRTDYMLILGGNPVVSNGNIMTAPNAKGRLRAKLTALGDHTSGSTLRRRTCILGAVFL